MAQYVKRKSHRWTHLSVERWMIAIAVSMSHSVEIQTPAEFLDVVCALNMRRANIYLKALYISYIGACHRLDTKPLSSEFARITGVSRSLLRELNKTLQFILTSENYDTIKTNLCSKKFPFDSLEDATKFELVPLYDVRSFGAKAAYLRAIVRDWGTAGSDEEVSLHSIIHPSKFTTHLVGFNLRYLQKANREGWVKIIDEKLKLK